MSKRKSRKYGASRRFGENLWGRPKDPVNVKNYPPGQHGRTGARKKTDYGVQLTAKRKFQVYYNLTESKLRKYYEGASRRRGDSGQNLIGSLESMLLSVVYRAGFVPTIHAARQVINHGHILVDGRKVNIYSCEVKPGQVISLKPAAQQIPMVVTSMASRERSVPEYLEVNDAEFTAKYLKVPSLSEVPYPARMEPNLVVEFYSR